MKNLVKIMLLSSLLIAIFQSCGGKDEPKAPGEDIRRYNSKDSIAFIEVMKAAYGSSTESVMHWYGIDLDDINTWGVENTSPNRPVNWEWFDDIKEYRIVFLVVSGLAYLEDDADYIEGYVSKHIWDMDSLDLLAISGKNIYGRIPERDMSCPSLTQLNISSTNITGIPNDLLKNQSSGFAYIINNKNLKTLPVGLIENIPTLDDPRATTVYLYNNGFEGTAPLEAERSVDLTKNNFTEVDWERLKSVDFKKKLMRLIPAVPFCSENKISGELPEWVLKDTLATIYSRYLIGDQKEGYGISNLPSYEEILNMMKEYADHHPEFKPYFQR